jgi:uncharacterized protein YecE (DUF72 family)
LEYLSLGEVIDCPMAPGEILVGTASWTDPTLLKSGRFYPPDANTPEGRLRYYASQFPVVEVDSSYYAMPSFNNSVLWSNRTPQQFVFDVKLFRIFTLHQTPLKALPKELREGVESLVNKAGNLYYRDLPAEIKDDLWRRFLEGLAPLKSAGRLGYLLLQLPPWEFKNRRNLEHIEECAGRLSDYIMAVEFRNVSWIEEGTERETLARLREWNLPQVIVDEPQGFHSSMPLLWETTSDEMAVVRFHGRNRDTWARKGLAASAQRVNYLYSRDELEEFVAPIERLRSETKQVHLIFNNCYEDKAQVNARQLIDLLSGT